MEIHHLIPSSPEYLPFKHCSSPGALHLPDRLNHLTHLPTPYRLTKNSALRNLMSYSGRTHVGMASVGIPGPRPSSLTFTAPSPGPCS